MRSTIPNDHPSLVLGSIVNPKLLDKLKEINKLQAEIDAAQYTMNSFISMKRSFDMTINELVNLKVNVAGLSGKIKEIDAHLTEAAGVYANARINNEIRIQGIREQIGLHDPNNIAESPVDFNKTAIKKVPLSTDSLKLDVQYFSYDGNAEKNPVGVIADIEKYISEITSGLGSKASADLSANASAQIALQQENHELSGTLIITASCTHKNSMLLTPLVIDADKAVSAWNRLYAKDKIDTANVAGLYAIDKKGDGDSKNSLPFLTGTSFGSGFVGMIHVLKKDVVANNTSSMTELAESMQERFRVGSWFEDCKGGFGVDPSFSDDIKNLLSSQKITSHVTLVVTGAIPSIKSNEVAMGVKTFADIDPGKLTAGLTSIDNLTSGEKSTVDHAANSARAGAKWMAMNNSTIQSIMLGLGKIDQTANKILDINSLMTAFEDYLEEVRKGDSGIPVLFFVKNLSKGQVIKLWLEKYYSGSAPSTVAEKPKKEA